MEQVADASASLICKTTSLDNATQVEDNDRWVAIFPRAACTWEAAYADLCGVLSDSAHMSPATTMHTLGHRLLSSVAESLAVSPVLKDQLGFDMADHLECK